MKVRSSVTRSNTSPTFLVFAMSPIPFFPELSLSELPKMKKDELKEFCRAHQRSVSGNKADLVLH